MIAPFALLLAFQLVGEIISRFLAIPVPGPVIGLLMLFLATSRSTRLADFMRPCTSSLLSILSLLFVPVGVGVIEYPDLLREAGPALLLILVASTLAALTVTAMTFALVSRLTREKGGE